MKSVFLSLFAASYLIAANPWRVPASEWSDADAQKVLQDSPWAKSDGRSRVTVRWESARPVRLALERTHAQPGAPNAADCLAIAIIGLKPTPGSTKLDATLKASGRKPVTASAVHLREDGVVFLFPRNDELWDPVTFRFPLGVKVGDSIEFRTKIGDQVIRRSFSLQGMTYEGRPEL